MPQQLGDLIFNRTQSDVSRVQSLTQKMIAGTATEAEKAEWLGGMKGAYNAADLNRVCAAVDYLTGVLTGLGYYVSTSLPEKKPVYAAKQIEYIESTGTQYIDTGFKPKWNTRLTMDVEVTSQTKPSNALFGERTTVSSIDSVQFNLWSMTNGNSVRFDYFGSNNSKNISLLGQRVQIDANKNVCTIGNTVFTCAEKTSGQASLNLYLFCINYPASSSQSDFFASMKLYSCKIYDNGTLVRDFKPYYDSSGVVCLFDAVSGTYYYNAGTGAFTASEEPTFEMAYWSENDIPMQAQMETYLENIQTLRDRLPYVAPDAPNDMTGLTYQEANNIEEILYTLERVLLAMQENFKLRQANTLFMIAGGVFNN